MLVEPGQGAIELGFHATAASAGPSPCSDRSLRPDRDCRRTSRPHPPGEPSLDSLGLEVVLRVASGENRPRAWEGPGCDVACVGEARGSLRGRPVQRGVAVVAKCADVVDAEGVDEAIKTGEALYETPRPDRRGTRSRNVSWPPDRSGSSDAPSYQPGFQVNALVDKGVTREALGPDLGGLVSVGERNRDVCAVRGVCIEHLGRGRQI